MLIESMVSEKKKQKEKNFFVLFSERFSPGVINVGNKS